MFIDTPLGEGNHPIWGQFWASQPSDSRPKPIPDVPPYNVKTPHTWNPDDGRYTIDIAAYPDACIRTYCQPSLAELACVPLWNADQPCDRCDSGNIGGVRRLHYIRDCIHRNKHLGAEREPALKREASSRLASVLTQKRIPAPRASNICRRTSH